MWLSTTSLITARIDTLSNRITEHEKEDRSVLLKGSTK